MRFVSLARIASLGLACAAIASCGDSTGPDPSATLDDLLADVTAAQSLAAGGSRLAGVTTAVSAGVPDPDACPFNSTTQMFVCPGTTVNGITVSRSFQLLDASNTPQSTFSRATTAAIRVVTDLSGTITSTTGATTTTAFVAHDDATLSGLLTGVHTLNGNGNANAIITAGGVTHTVAATQTITDLVLPKRGSANRYPESGAITVNVTIATGLVSQNLRVTITFNGSSTAMVVITSDGVTHACTIDLSKPNAEPACAL